MSSETPAQASAQFWQHVLGVYFLLSAVALSFFIYVFWPARDNDDGWLDTLEILPGTIDHEHRLILLVMLAGALGSYVHAVTSFVTYVGNRSGSSSWIWWYVSRPFIGVALALIFYFVIRGGLLSAGAGADDVSPFGIAAVAGLAGMFSKQATDKLREVFDDLFKTEKGKGDDQRKGKVEEERPSRID